MWQRRCLPGGGSALHHEQNSVLQQVWGRAMTGLRCIVCLAAILCWLFGCSKQIVPLRTESSLCEELAKNSALNESCAVGLAKNEIVQRQGKLDYQRFEARFHEPDKLWV